jgi:hypothetical protein
MIPLARGITSREHPHSFNVSNDDLIRTCSYFAEPYFIGMRAGNCRSRVATLRSSFSAKCLS